MGEISKSERRSFILEEVVPSRVLTELMARSLRKEIVKFILFRLLRMLRKNPVESNFSQARVQLELRTLDNRGWCSRS